jgi:hypothetical protein
MLVHPFGHPNSGALSVLFLYFVHQFEYSSCIKWLDMQSMALPLVAGGRMQYALLK